MAEISPELAEKIRELSARYEENPGRFFVPLANAYRDAGEIGQAEELLRSGLKRYTGYLSAHIVLGRCLADRGAAEEAAHEFRYVLSVDPQNLIALRTLGEMAAAQGRAGEAARWYRELLAVDPMNKEAQGALDALGPAADLPSPSAPEQPSAPGYGDLGSEFGLVDIAGEHGAAPAEFGMVDPGAANEPHLPAPDAAQQGSELADFGVVDLSPPAPAASAPEPSPEPAGPPIDFGGWGEVSLDDGAPAAAEPKGEGRMREYDTFSFGDVELDAGASAGAPAAAPEPAGPPPLDGSLGYDLAPQEDDEEVVTETMAELYARQGFHDRAIDVYRELVRRRGDEPALVRRLAELETLAAKEAATGVESAVIEPPALGTAAFLDPVEDVALPVMETGLPGLNFTPGGGLPFEPIDASGAGAGGTSGELPVLEGLSFGAQDMGPAVSSETPSDAGTGFAAPTEPAEAFAAGDWMLGGPVEDATLPFPPSPPAFDAGFTVENDASPAPGLESFEAPEPAQPAAAPTGDAFADSFAHGFGEAGPDAAPAEAAQPEAQAEQPAAAEPSAPVAEAPQAVSEEPIEEPRSEPAVSAEAQQPPEASQAAAGAPRTVGSYLNSLLSWRPGQVPAPATPSFEDQATGTQSFETDSFQAQPIETQSFDLPPAENAPGSPQPEAPAEEPAAGLPWMDAPATETPPAEAPAPWDAAPWEQPEQPPAAPAEPEPFEISSLGFDLPPQPAGEPTVQGAAEEPLPWELGSPQAPPPPAPVPEAPRQSPTPPEGGFSFEDFFSAPAAEPEQPPAPPTVPEPAPPADAEPGPPAAPGGGEDDEDLESFQAWLQSLKR
jgi:tetratricopeptide (TPR) repeat protein